MYQSSVAKANSVSNLHRETQKWDSLHKQIHAAVGAPVGPEATRDEQSAMTGGGVEAHAPLELWRSVCGILVDMVAETAYPNHYSTLSPNTDADKKVCNNRELELWQLRACGLVLRSSPASITARTGSTVDGLDDFAVQGLTTFSDLSAGLPDSNIHNPSAPTSPSSVVILRSASMLGPHVESRVRYMLRADSSEIAKTHSDSTDGTPVREELVRLTRLVAAPPNATTSIPAGPTGRVAQRQHLWLLGIPAAKEGSGTAGSSSPNLGVIRLLFIEPAYLAVSDSEELARTSDATAAWHEDATAITSLPCGGQAP